MVLSNKKLKQKLRAEFAEISLLKATNSNISINPETPKSLKQLLDSSAQKPRLSKREKHREILSSLPNNGENNDIHVEGELSRGKKRRRERQGGVSEGVLELEKEENGEKGENLKEKKEKKKRKKEKNVGEKSSELKKAEKAPVKISKKKKKKKKKKTMKKTEDEVREKQIEVENGAVSEQIVAEDSQGNEDDRKKVYVGGMPYSSTEDDIWSYFDHCGAITEIDCMKFPESGKFRGIAIISFKTEDAVKKALALDGSDMEGLYLKIQPYKTTRIVKSSDFSPPAIEGYNRIYAGNLSWDLAEDDLRKLFSDCNISSIRFGEDKETGEFKGYAHVDFSDNASLTKALKLDQKVVCGRPVKISCAVPKKGALNTPASASMPPPAVKHQEVVKPHENLKPQEDVIPQVDNSGVSSGKLKRRTCYECGEKGHISTACPKKRASEQIDPIAS